MPADSDLMEKLTALCKRRGFIYPSSEIYGGIGGFWDYGPMGVELKRNVKDAWWHDMVTNPPDGPEGREVAMVGVDCSIIMNPKVWEASGHVGGFSDPMVDCKECKGRFRADTIWQVHVMGITADKVVRDEQVNATGAEGLAKADVLARNIARGATASQVVPQEDGTFRVFYLTEPVGRVDTYGVLANSEEEATLHTWPFARKLAKKHRIVLGGFVALTYEYQGNDPIRCPACQGDATLTEPREFNLMFETYVGALQDASSKAYLRPETAQGIFVNFMNVLDTYRIKVPFGIAQVGKSFRNEINPRNFTFRSREFEQMEMEFFCREDEAANWFKFWREQRFNWYVKLGLKSEKLRLRDHDADELAHYSSACADIEYLYPFSDEFQELEGVACRGCYDLAQHQKHSGKDLTYFDDDLWQQHADKYKDDKEKAKEVKNKPPYRYLPHVIEPAAGADRSTLAFLCEAYTEDEQPDDKGKLRKRVVMKLHPRLAPIKVAVFPLVNKEGMPDIAYALYRGAKKHMRAFYDAKGAIGRRYRRQDEVGTPFCVTVDGDTLEDGTVTIRDRDTLEQVRVKKEAVVDWLRDHLSPEP